MVDRLKQSQEQHDAAVCVIADAMLMIMDSGSATGVDWPAVVEALGVVDGRGALSEDVSDMLGEAAARWGYL